MENPENTLDLFALRQTHGFKWKQYKPGRRPAGYECAVCGTVCPNPAYLGRFIGGSLDTVATDEEADRPENQAGDMGCYPVGPECAKRLKKVLGQPTFDRFFAQVEKE